MMRRKDKKITDRAQIDAIIRDALVCRIALHDGDMPYIVPLSFGYDGKNIYIHSAAEGRKIDILRQNPRLCFELETHCAVLPAEKACSFTMRYQSVIGYGTASFIENAREKIRAVQCIMNHYTDGDFIFTPHDIDRIAVLRIDIEEISGKQSGFPHQET